jgi:hypothetical protein
MKSQEKEKDNGKEREGSVMSGESPPAEADALSQHKEQVQLQQQPRQETEPAKEDVPLNVSTEEDAVRCAQVNEGSGERHEEGARHGETVDVTSAGSDQPASELTDIVEDVKDHASVNDARERTNTVVDNNDTFNADVEQVREQEQPERGVEHGAEGLPEIGTDTEVAKSEEAKVAGAEAEAGDGEDEHGTNSQTQSHFRDASLASSTITAVDILPLPAPLSPIPAAPEKELDLKAVDKMDDGVEKSEDVINQQKTGVDAVNVEEINPFLVDDPEDPVSDPESVSQPEAGPSVEEQIKEKDPGLTGVVAVVNEERQPELPAIRGKNEQTVAEDVLQTSAAVPSSPTITASDVSDYDLEDVPPELHTPALNVTSLFLPVPHVRLLVSECFRLSWWLTTAVAPSAILYLSRRTLWARS